MCLLLDMNLEFSESMETTSVLLDCTAFHPSCSSGGVSVYKQEVIPALADEFRFKAFYKDADTAALDACSPAIDERVPVRGNMLIWRDRAVRRFAREGGKGVWFPTQFSAWAAPLPAMVTIHDMAALLAWSSFGVVARAYMPATLFASCRNAKTIIAVSESSASDLCRLFPWARKRAVVARHGLPSDVRTRAIEVGIGQQRVDGPISAIFLDGANRRKRLDLCLLALEKYGWADIELRITGNADSVKERIRRVLGYVPRAISCVGRLERPILIDALAASDLLLYPSDFEGFGFPLIEAMAFGTTVVSFPGNAEKEIGGHYGIYSERSDASALLLSIQIALERIRDRAWQQSLVKHALSFNWDQSIAVHREALGRLIV